MNSWFLASKKLVSAKLLTIMPGVAAFCVYFAMYGFRKPIAAAGFDGIPAVFAGLDYKTALILSQAVGYALSKMIGVHVVSVHRPEHRTRLILSLIGAAWGALLLLALLPARFGPLAMLLNGLPLGMIWGLVFSYLEGRRNSEVLASILTASFILSSGATRSVGSLLLVHGVSAFWMPALTGLIFTPLLLVGMVALARSPAPDAADADARGIRGPMNAAARRAYLRRHWVPVTALIAGYTMLAALRDLRDNFAPELWMALDRPATPALYLATEVPVAIIVLLGLAMLGLVRDNRYGVVAIHGVIIAGATILGGSMLALRAGAIGPVTGMILTGIGIYLAYAPFSAILFDRIMAVSPSPGTAGFLIYLADAFGYSGSIGLLLVRSATVPGRDWLGVFLDAGMLTGAALLVLTFVSALWFVRHPQGR
ncbi:DUF5690 family protein [Sphingomonas sp. PB2P12]|uniref:DUF5690 family protein n=1 Tax=Sphingomonas sandaracina TaxID=3096157 RepID=UPI002FCB8BF9